MNTNRYNFLDVVRLFLAICIVAWHSAPNVSTLGKGVESVYYELVKLVVPTFFIMSGFFSLVKI